MRISLDRLARTIYNVENSCQRKYSRHTLDELENALNRLHGLEKEIEKIDDIFIRGYIYEKLDITVSSRRSLVEEVKWDIESKRKRLE